MKRIVFDWGRLPKLERPAGAKEIERRAADATSRFLKIYGYGSRAL